MKFTFPTSFTFLDLLALARRGQFDPADFHGGIELDFSQLTFAGSDGMACIKALLAHEQRQLSSDFYFPISPQCQDAIRYLSRMDFFSDDIRWRMMPGEEDFILHSEASRFMPIRNLHGLHETDATTRGIVSCLNCHDAKSGQIFQYAVSELLDNALQHSNAQTGAFATAQIYGKASKVHALIVDTGIGVQKHLARHPRFQNIRDDITAIQTAIKPFVTGTYFSDPREERREYENQGLGLSVIDEVARRSGGELYIWSGHALYRSRSGAETMPVEWPGTVVFLTLPTSLTLNVTEIVKGFDLGLRKSKTHLKFNP